MSIGKTLATARRVLNQLRHDPRTIVLMLAMPCLLLTLLRYVFDGKPQVFNAIAPMMLGIFPLLMMFLITSITTLRERTNGTFERLMTQPIAKTDLMFGYALAFSLLGLIQASLASYVTVGLLDVEVAGGALPLLLVAVITAFLGTSLGLFVSAFATSEFQAVELVMPIIMPQVLLCGLFVPRDQMATLLQRIADILPLTYSVEAMQQVTQHASWTSTLTHDLLIVVGYACLALVLGAATIRRKD